MQTLNSIEIALVCGGDTGSLIPGYTTQTSPVSSGSSFGGFINGGDRDPNQARINAQLAAYIAANPDVPRGQAYADFFNL